MGYLSNVSGEIAVQPPIPARRLNDSPFLPSNRVGSSEVIFHVTESTEETDEGTLTRRTVTKIVAAWTDAYKAYHLKEQLREAVAYILAEGSTCTGELIRVGEDAGDVERFTVRADGSIEIEKARLVWGDGTEVDL